MRHSNHRDCSTGQLAARQRFSKKCLRVDMHIVSYLLRSHGRTYLSVLEPQPTNLLQPRNGEQWGGSVGLLVHYAIVHFFAAPCVTFAIFEGW